MALVPYAVMSEVYCAFVQLRAHSVFAGLALSSAAVAVDFPTATYALTCLAVLCAAMRSPLAAGIAQLLAAAFGLVARGWWPCLLIAAAGMLLSPKAFAVSCLAPSIWACWMQRGGAHVLLWGTVGAWAPKGARLVEDACLGFCYRCRARASPSSSPSSATS